MCPVNITCWAVRVRVFRRPQATAGPKIECTKENACLI